MKAEIEPVTQSNSQIAIKEICLHESVEHHKTYYYDNPKPIQFCHDPTPKIEEIHKAVLDIAKYELVPVSEFPRITCYI